MKRRGFTLIEILYVVAIMGVLLGIALPNFALARDHARAKSCISNLRMIDSAKEMYALDNRVSTGTFVSLRRLTGTYIKAYRVRSNFSCPASGLRYTSGNIGPIGQAPQCPTPGGSTLVPPHILP